MLFEMLKCYHSEDFHSEFNYGELGTISCSSLNLEISSRICSVNSSASVLRVSKTEFFGLDSLAPRS